jgi:hypothetical protein
MAGPLIILLEPGWAQGQSCPDGIWLIWGAFVRRANKVYNDLSRDRTISATCHTPCAPSSRSLLDVLE